MLHIQFIFRLGTTSPRGNLLGFIMGGFSTRDRRYGRCKLIVASELLTVRKPVVRQQGLSEQFPRGERSHYGAVRKRGQWLPQETVQKVVTAFAEFQVALLRIYTVSSVFRKVDFFFLYPPLVLS